MINMREYFDTELEKLTNEIIEMGKLVSNITLNLHLILKNNDIALAKNMLNYDTDIKEMERKIVDRCIKLIMREQPVAKDLRLISATLKLVTDLERISRQSLASIELAYNSLEIGNIVELEDLINMSKEVSNMVNDAVKSVINKDQVIASYVIEYDDKVDNYFNICKKDIIGLIREDKEDPEILANMLIITKYLERIADHAVNVSSWTKFAITGE